MIRTPALVGALSLCGCVFTFGDPPQDPQSVTVPQQGGTVSFPGGPSLRIPPGALRDSTRVSIVQSGAVRPSRALSPVYEFEPAETAFALPATVSFPLPQGTREAVIYWSAGSGSQYQLLETVVEADVAEAPVTRLGTGFVAAPVGEGRTVSGALSTVFWADDGTKTARDGAVFPPMAVTAILVPNGSGYDRFPIEGSASRFSVPGVPAGRYFLQVDTTWPATSFQSEAVFTQLIELSTSEPDLSRVVAGRPDLTLAAEASSPVTIDVANLTPWVYPANGFTGDILVLASSQAHAFLRPSAAQGPAAGSTTAHFAFDWSRVSTSVIDGLPDASKGDVAYLYQRSTHSVGAGATAGVARVATRYQRLDSLTVRRGSSTSIQASLADAPQTGSIRADLRNAQFAALMPQVNDHATANFQSGGVSVLAVPHSIDFPEMPDDGTSSILWVQGPSTSNVDYGPVSYGQFLGPLWQELRYVAYFLDVNLPVPGSSVTYPATGAFVSFVPASSQTPVAPALGPPQSLRIEGRDAFTSQSSVGLSPSISWSPPVLGTATSYLVKVDLVNLGPAAPGLQEIAMSVYSGTSVRIPSGFLQSGRQYTVTVSAVAAPWDTLDHAPFRTGTPYHSADCVSAIFSP